MSDQPIPTQDVAGPEPLRDATRDDELPNPEAPEFAIPLLPEQLIWLGALTATWSQIDYLVAFAVAVITRTEIGQTLMFCENMMTGARINLLRKTIPQIEDDDARRLAKSLCERLGKLVDRRNHIVHGIWGLHTKEKGPPEPACHNGRNSDTPINATELPALCKRAINETRQLGRLLKLLAPQDFGPAIPPRQFFFGKFPPPNWAPEQPDEPIEGHR